MSALALGLGGIAAVAFLAWLWVRDAQRTRERAARAELEVDQVDQAIDAQERVDQVARAPRRRGRALLAWLRERAGAAPPGSDPPAV